VAMSSLRRGTRGAENLQVLQVVYNRMDHVPYTLEVTINSSVAALSIVRVFLISVSRPSIVIEMDKWLAQLSPGQNTITRREEEAPHISRRSTQSLRGLQRLLVSGRMSRQTFNWAGCGWPISLNIPTGSVGGSSWQLVVVASPLKPHDVSNVQQWDRAGRVSWSYCGVDRGQVPDSRPLGFPFDRPSTAARLQDLVDLHSNIASTPVTIYRGQLQGGRRPRPPPGRYPSTQVPSTQPPQTQGPDNQKSTARESVTQVEPEIQQAPTQSPATPMPTIQRSVLPSVTTEGPPQPLVSRPPATRRPAHPHSTSTRRPSTSRQTTSRSGAVREAWSPWNRNIFRRPA